MLFKDLCFEWLEFKRCSIKISTVSTYTRMLMKQIIPVFGDKKCSDLSENDIVLYINELLKSMLSSKTIQDIVVVMKSIIRYGNMKQEMHLMLELIPCPKNRKKNVEVLTHTEVKEMLDYMNNHYSYKNLGILLSLYTGMRLGEVCALKWESVDLENKKIMIRQTLQRVYLGNETKIVVLEPKTEHSIREIPIQEKLEDILINIENREGYVLTCLDKYVDPRTLQKHFSSIMKKIGYEKTSFHILRHTFATTCIQCDIDIKSLSEMLGHSSVQMTLDRYVHSSFDIKVEQMKKLKY